ncbi:MAG: beta-ketoacyl synthase N-terminal-like domain-containing protein, partial [Acidimicrobiales bacterium]|nr:beta-ketoacyl synthase N-terminal-like domain-containing protein [Acidimicrobiales bacterium]
MLGRRVAVTGIGVVAPAGIGKDAFWSGLLSPAPNGFRQIEDWDPSPYFDNSKEARRSDRVSQFTLAAAVEALEQAGEISADPARRGTFVGTGVGGIGTLEEQIEVRLSKGERRVSPFLVPMMMANAPAATISMRYGWQGPCENTVTACAAGTHAIGNAARMVADGRCDVVMAGGAEAPFTPTAVAGFGNMTALSNSGDSRPFDTNRDGFVTHDEFGAAMAKLGISMPAEAVRQLMKKYDFDGDGKVTYSEFMRALAVPPAKEDTGGHGPLTGLQARLGDGD